MSIHNDGNYPPSEWSRSRIAMRFFMYSLCFFLLILDMIVLVEGQLKSWKDWMIMIGNVGFCLAYIIIDIRVIIIHGRKRQEFKKKFPTSEG